MSGRYALETYYVGAREPHVVIYDTLSDALDIADLYHRTRAGIAFTLARPLKSAIPQQGEMA